MKRQIFMLSMALVLVMGAALTAQTTTTTTQPVPPSQQVDQSGQPETGSGMDVDVDAGANADGLVDVDVTATTDRDTAANEQTSALQDDQDRNPVTTGTTATGNAVRDVTNTDDDMDQTGTYDGTTDTTMDDQNSLPNTGSEMPLVALIGLIALAGAFAFRAIR